MTDIQTYGMNGGSNATIIAAVYFPYDLSIGEIIKANPMSNGYACKGPTARTPGQIEPLS